MSLLQSKVLDDAQPVILPHLRAVRNNFFRHFMYVVLLQRTKGGCASTIDRLGITAPYVKPSVAEICKITGDAQIT